VIDVLNGLMIDLWPVSGRDQGRGCRGEIGLATYAETHPPKLGQICAFIRLAVHQDDRPEIQLAKRQFAVCR
jgi:hypothetical protein